MKSLIFLKELQKSRDYDGNLEFSLNEAIAELEELIKLKTCAGCKQSWMPNNQTFHKLFCEYLRIPVHGNFCCNRYEQKV